MKKFLWTVFGGALFGTTLFAWVSPYVLTWYFSPPVDVAISCKESVGWAFESYRKMLVGGFITGAIISAIVFILMKRRKKNPTPIQSLG